MIQLGEKQKNTLYCIHQLSPEQGAHTQTQRSEGMTSVVSTSCIDVQFCLIGLRIMQVNELLECHFFKGIASLKHVNCDLLPFLTLTYAHMLRMAQARAHCSIHSRGDSRARSHHHIHTLINKSPPCSSIIHVLSVSVIRLHSGPVSLHLSLTSLQRLGQLVLQRV